MVERLVNEMSNGKEPMINYELWPKCYQLREILHRPFEAFRQCVLDENATGYGTGDYTPVEDAVKRTIQEVLAISAPDKTDADKQLQELFERCYILINDLLDYQKPDEKASDDLLGAWDILAGILRLAQLLGHDPTEGMSLFYNVVANEIDWELE